MKLTKETLKQIIKEELDSVMEYNREFVRGDGGIDRISGIKTALSKARISGDHPKQKETRAKLDKMSNKTFTRDSAMGPNFLYVKDEGGNILFAANHKGNNRADSAEEELLALGYAKV